MKKQLIVLLFPFFSILCRAQNAQNTFSEFANQTTRLMYADSTMSMLRHMVDSLNIRFKSCKTSPAYYSRPQGRVWTIRFEGNAEALKPIRKDLRNHADFQQIFTRYKALADNVDTGHTVLIKFCITGIEEDDENRFYLKGSAGQGYERDYDLNENSHPETIGNWIFTYKQKNDERGVYELECRYLPDGFIQKQIPQEYANYIAYVDCMIDTSAIVSQATGSTRLWGANIKLAELDDVNQYLNRVMKIKASKKDDNYLYKQITEEKCEYAIGHLVNDANFIQLLSAAADACMENSTGNDALEEMISKIISKQKALDLKRHRKVVGFCSMDQSPRIHARNIAILAAETNSWDIFLRAHMDIMNDRFERMSDGSYAYGGRQTYLKELEALNLNVTDLMIGLTLRADKTAYNHYYGNIWRLGRAISEINDGTLFETKAVQMMQDERLDDFNRGLMYMLYVSYLSYLPDVNVANKKIIDLKKNSGDFPSYIASAIMQIRERKE